jgi:hypothetical protein
MRFQKTLLLFAFFFATSASAQNPPDAVVPPATPSPEPPPAVQLKHRLPDAPQPQSGDAQPACPAGNGKPCALLGGRLYFADALALSRHNKSWLDAARSPGMVLSLGLLTTATVADIQTTHACIRSGACREGNPLLGQSRGQAYAVSMSLNAFAFWAGAEQKRHGHGVAPFFILWSGSVLHAALAVHNAGLSGR